MSSTSCEGPPGPTKAKVEAASALSMTDLDPLPPPLARPKRADAQRNRDKLLAAATETFASEGAAASLEAIARRAGVGIGTLYRHFPTRQALLEAVYVDEMEAVCRSAQDLAALEPWEALSSWLRRFVGYAATKRALAQELFHYIDADSEVFKASGAAITAAGEPLLKRAQAAGVARPDAEFGDVARMVGGIAQIHTADAAQIDRILGMALDGLRYRPPGAGA
jgi:AcrR family transcriptional regulator